MSLNPFAPAFLRPYQSASDPPISLCNSTAMSLPLAQFFCGVPPAIIPSHAPPTNQPITHNTFILPFIQPKNPSNKVAEILQPIPGFSSLLPPPLQHQAQCLQPIHKTIQQFHQPLKVEQFDQKTRKIIVLQLQNDLALLRYLLFSSVGTIPVSDKSIRNSTTSPPINPIPNPNPASNAPLLPCAAEPSVRNSTPGGAVGTPRAKTNNSANVYFQSPPNTREIPPTTAQNLTSRISKLGKYFSDETATFTSIIAGIYFQYFFLYDKIRQLELGNSDAIIWKNPSVKFVVDSAKVARPSSDPLIEPAISFRSSIFRTHLHGYP